MQENIYSDSVNCFCFGDKSNVKDKSVEKIASDVVQCNLEIVSLPGNDHLGQVNGRKRKGSTYPEYISPAEQQCLLRKFNSCEVLRETDQPNVFRFNGSSPVAAGQANLIPALICVSEPVQSEKRDELSDRGIDSNILYSTNGDTFCSYPVLILCSKGNNNSPVIDEQNEKNGDGNEIKIESVEETVSELDVEQQIASKDLKTRLHQISIPDKKKVRFNAIEMDANFRVTLSIKNEVNGQAVFYKADKNRFRRDKTVKLMSNSFYRVDISFKPTQTLARAVISGQEVKATERVHDSTASAYSLHLSTSNMSPSHKGQRDELPLIIQLSNGLLLHLTLQVKVYKEGDTHHCDWGSTFHCVEYDCECYSDTGVVTVLKETFR